MQFQPCTGCGETHDPEDCLTGNNQPELEQPEEPCEECDGLPCYSHCAKYGTNESE